MAKNTDLTYLDIKASAALVEIDAETAYQFAQGEIGWQDVVASEIALDSDSLNRYFRNEVFSFSDAATLNLEKTALDSFGFTDSQTLSVQKALVDAFAFSDEVLIALAIFRNFDDTVSISDVSVLSIDKGVADSVPITEVLAIGLSTAKSDALTMTEAAQLGVSKAESDPVFMTDDFDRAVSYVRAFSDQFALDDAATVDAFRKDTDSNKVNVFTFADTQVFVVAKSLADSISLADVFDRVVSYSRAFTDAFTLDDQATVDAFVKDTDSLKSNILGFSDEHVFTLSKPEADVLSVTDLAALTTSRQQSESITVSESFAREVAFSRAFADSFSLDDAATVDAFTKDTDSNKANVFSFSDVQVFGTSKQLTDSFSITESNELLLSKSAQDSFSLGESINVSLFTTVSSVLATSALNTYALNS